MRDNIYFNTDLTPDQRTVQFNARNEIKRHRAASEIDLIIRSGRVIKKSL